VRLGRELTSRSQHRVGQWMKWMRPGLLVKRWVLISILGLLLALLGLATWVDLRPVYFLISQTRELLRTLTQAVPNNVSGPLVVALGLLLLYLGAGRRAALPPAPQQGPEDCCHRRRHRPVDAAAGHEAVQLQHHGHRHRGR
jgi:ABC-type nickel/cobalt efflux system permease component RcnA